MGVVSVLKGGTHTRKRLPRSAVGQAQRRQLLLLSRSSAAASQAVVPARPKLDILQRAPHDEARLGRQLVDQRLVLLLARGAGSGVGLRLAAWQRCAQAAEQGAWRATDTDTAGRGASSAP